MLRLVHSFNTRPVGIDLYGVGGLRRLLGNVWYFALSAAYARESGAEVVLHTDSLGRALLGHLPYREVHETLDGMPDGIHPRFWAAGKVWAMAQEGVESVHIDGDVFLKREGLVRMLEGWMAEGRGVAQHWESSEWYGKELVAFEGLEGWCEERGLRVWEDGAYNTGVLGFGSEGLKGRFVEGYREIAERVSRDKRELLDRGSFLTPDVIVEQRYFYQLARGGGVGLVLGEGGGDVGERAREIGYQHVMTSVKFDMLDRCKRCLEMVSPVLFEKTRRLCRSI